MHFFVSSLKCTYETKNKQETIRVIFFNQSNLIKKEPSLKATENRDLYKKFQV
jgi:hypothetical protein